MPVKLLKPFVFLAALVPAGHLLWGFLNDRLGGNPIEAITHGTGEWALRFLLLTLLISPARKLLKRPELIRFRRMFGLFAFFYAVLHVLTWAWLDKLFDPHEILADVQKRPFITAGAVAFLSMLPLAATSTSGWIRRLGGKQWRALHRLVYLAGVAAVVHFYWLVKSDVREPLLYGAILAVLFTLRIWLRLAQRPISVRPSLERS
jgi:sulfoxide reductase heme-binding subunit YedZ